MPADAIGSPSKTPGRKKKPGEEKWLDVESKRQATQLTASLTEYVYFLANDPSVAQQRIAQNIHRSVPSYVQKAEQTRSLHTEAKGVNEDLVLTVRDLEHVCDLPVFKSVHSKLVCATEFAKQLLTEDDQ